MYYMRFDRHPGLAHHCVHMLIDLRDFSYLEIARPTPRLIAVPPSGTLILIISQMMTGLVVQVHVSRLYKRPQGTANTAFHRTSIVQIRMAAGGLDTS